MTADELAKLRNRFGWSQAETAKRLGCSVRLIINWEQGVSKIPKSVALAAAAVVMDIPPYGGK